MKLTTVAGMQSEIFVPVTPVPVFTELKKPRKIRLCRFFFCFFKEFYESSSVLPTQESYINQAWNQASVLPPQDTRHIL